MEWNQVENNSWSWGRKRGTDYLLGCVFSCVQQIQKKPLCPQEEDGVFSLCCCCCCCLVSAKSCPALLWPHGLQPTRPLCPCCVNHTCPAHQPHSPPLLRFLVDWGSYLTHDAELRRRRKEPHEELTETGVYTCPRSFYNVSWGLLWHFLKWRGWNKTMVFSVPRWINSSITWKSVENANFLTLPQTYWSRNCEWGPVSLVNPPGDYDPGQPLNQKKPTKVPSTFTGHSLGLRI